VDNFESNGVMHCFCVSYDETFLKEGGGKLGGVDWWIGVEENALNMVQFCSTCRAPSKMFN
jgi:hypothetical protein